MLSKILFGQEKSIIKELKYSCLGNSFIQRHKLSKQIADNVKSSRPEVNEHVSSECFDNIENETKNIPLSNVFNYDETNITDNPNSKLVISQR